MKPHLRYLRYVLLHKFYVFRAGLALAKVRGHRPSVAWLWRLLVHDLTKFSRIEWGPYVANFYGDSPEVVARREMKWPYLPNLSPSAAQSAHDERVRLITKRAAEIKRERQAAFNYAWLHHQQRNPHHWQHWMLREDSGKTIVLLAPATLADEMVCDWLAAGPKALRAHTMAEAVTETIVWYSKARTVMQLREPVRFRVEGALLQLAEHYGITQWAHEMAGIASARASLTIPGSW